MDLTLYQNVPKVTEILKVEPFKITCRFSDSQLRVIDFEPEFINYKLENYSLLLPLCDYNNFKFVIVNESHTLSFPTILVKDNFNGKETTQPLDLDPLVLYELSKPIDDFRLIPVNSI